MWFLKKHKVIIAQYLEEEMRDKPQSTRLLVNLFTCKLFY